MKTFATFILLFPLLVTAQIDIPARDVMGKPGIDMSDKAHRDRMRDYQRELDGPSREKEAPGARRDSGADRQGGGNSKNGTSNNSSIESAPLPDVYKNNILAIKSTLDALFVGAKNYTVNYNTQTKNTVINVHGSVEVVAINSKPQLSSIVQKSLGTSTEAQYLAFDYERMFSQVIDHTSPVDRLINRNMQETAQGILKSMFPAQAADNAKNLSKLRALEKTWDHVTKNVGFDSEFTNYLSTVRDNLHEYSRWIDETGTGPLRHEMSRVTKALEQAGYELLSSGIQEAFTDKRLNTFDTVTPGKKIIQSLEMAQRALTQIKPNFFEASKFLGQALSDLEKTKSPHETIAPDDFIDWEKPIAALILGLSKPAVRGLLKSGMTQSEKVLARTEALKDLTNLFKTRADNLLTNEANALIKAGAKLGVIAEYTRTKLGPLSKIIVDSKTGLTVADTFLNNKYLEVILNEELTVYRYTNATSPTQLGRFWTLLKAKNNIEAIEKLALPSNNLARQWIEIKLPKETKLYIGTAAPLNGQPGLGNQIYIDKIIPNDWIENYGTF